MGEDRGEEEGGGVAAGALVIIGFFMAGLLKATGLAGGLFARNIGGVAEMFPD